VEGGRDEKLGAIFENGTYKKGCVTHLVWGSYEEGGGKTVAALRGKKVGRREKGGATLKNWSSRWQNDDTLSGSLTVSRRTARSPKEMLGWGFFFLLRSDSGDTLNWLGGDRLYPGLLQEAQPGNRAQKRESHRQGEREVHRAFYSRCRGGCGEGAVSYRYHTALKGRVGQP